MSRTRPLRWLKDAMQRWPLTTSVVVLAFALLVVTVSFGIYVTSTEAARSNDRGITDCRSRIAANLSSAQVEAEIARGENGVALDALVVKLARSTTADQRPSYEQEIAAIETAEGTIAAATTNLRAARDARLAFEASPTTDCGG